MGPTWGVMISWDDQEKGCSIRFSGKREAREKVKTKRGNNTKNSSYCDTKKGEPL